MSQMHMHPQVLSLYASLGYIVTANSIKITSLINEIVKEKKKQKNGCKRQNPRNNFVLRLFFCYFSSV